MDDESVDVALKRMSELLDEDCRNAAVAYAVKHGARAQTFVDGAVWMMNRMPQFVAQIKATAPGDDCVPAEGPQS